jgi:hypothetical protein
MFNVTKVAMSTRSKFVVAAAIAMLGLASPASAQSYNRTEGSGNSLPMYYDSQGGKADLTIVLNDVRFRG